RFHRRLATHPFRRGAGTGKSGEVTALEPGQKILPRTAVLVDGDCVRLIFFVGLHAAGRRILGRECLHLFQEGIPDLLLHTLTAVSLDQDALRRHLAVLEDHAALADSLESRGWVGFVADGSCLPRLAGNSDRPLAEGAVPFAAPEGLAATVALPHAGQIRGMPIPRGVTLLVGGGFHGKSTLLRALQDAVYPHIPGDGREQVAVLPAAVKIRAEDGRAAHRVDISAFLETLPGVPSTRSFSTQTASGSTSQAVNIMEALEAGSRLLLLDEDTCATNFMVRDARMQALVHKDREPITPFIDRVRELYDRRGVSTVLVMGGCGDYFDDAGAVVAMERFQPRLVTEEARRIAADHPTSRRREALSPLPEIQPRRHPLDRLHFGKGHTEWNITVRGRDTLVLGRTEVEARYIEQIAEPGQLEACGWMAAAVQEMLGADGVSTVAALQTVFEKVRAKGLACLMPYNNGRLCLPRLQDVMAVLNRMR
ncbi:MAG: P-loop domain-containing protein, partial [Nitrospinaceae bacterium]